MALQKGTLNNWPILEDDGAVGTPVTDVSGDGGDLLCETMGRLAQRTTSSASDPSVTEFPNNKDWGFHVNTTSGNVFVCFNQSGTIRKVQLT